MGNNKRERRERARLARTEGSAPARQDAAPHAQIPVGEAHFRIRPDKQIDDMIEMARNCQCLGVLPSARKIYTDLLPLAERERGWDDPVTLEILASFIELLRVQGDVEEAARVMLARSAGPHPQSATPRPQTPRPLAFEEITLQIRRDHQIDDTLIIARLYHSRGVLPTARKWYQDLLPMAERERGRDHPVTLGIVASLIEVYYAQSDRAAAMALMMARAKGSMAG